MVQKLTEIKKGQVGTGLLIEHDGYVSLDMKENKLIKEAIEDFKEDAIPLRSLIACWYFCPSLFNTFSGYILPFAFSIPYFWNTADTTNGRGRGIASSLKSSIASFINLFSFISSET